MENDYPVIDITSDDDSSDDTIIDITSDDDSSVGDASASGGGASASGGGASASGGGSSASGGGAEDEEDDTDRDLRRDYISISRFVNSVLEEENRSHVRLDTDRNRRVRRRVGEDEEAAAEAAAAEAAEAAAAAAAAVTEAEAALAEALAEAVLAEAEAVLAELFADEDSDEDSDEENQAFGMDAAAMAEAQPPVAGVDAGRDEILNQVISLVDGETVPAGSTCVICIHSDAEIQTEVGNGWVQTRCVCGRGDTNIDVTCMCSNCLVTLVRANGWNCPVCRGDMRG
jgi:hypothetical protein